MACLNVLPSDQHLFFEGKDITNETIAISLLGIRPNNTVSVLVDQPVDSVVSNPVTPLETSP
jgi:hypothetical protein